MSESDTHTILSNKRRLLTIRYLALYEPGCVLDVRHVARVVRGIELGVTPRQLGSTEYESAYNGLIQTHLPKLEEAGILDYNERKKVVMTRPRVKSYGTNSYVSEFIREHE